MGGHLRIAPSARLSLYALGGGRGHATRGAAVAEALAARGATVSLLVPARNALLAATLAPSAAVVALERPGSPRALATAVAAAVAAHGADALVVDTFPEGLLEELSEVAVPRYALLRLRRDVHGERFQRGLAGCAGAADLEPSLRWLDDARVIPLAEVARELGDGGGGAGGEGGEGGEGELADNSVCVLGGDDSSLERLLERLAHRLVACGVRVRRVLDGVGPLWFGPPGGRPRVVVGAAGYNLTYELARAGVHHLAVPRPRPFDDQRRRALAVAEPVTGPEDLERRVLELLLGPRPRARPAPAAAVRGHDVVADWLLEGL